MSSLDKYKHVPMLKKLYNNVDKILLSSINLYFTYDDIDDIYKRYNKNIEKPKLPLDIVHHIRIHLFNNDFNADMFTLNEQNEYAKSYVHFDYSMKRPKCLKDLL